LGCYGDRVVKTPNIDSIAAKGLRFTNAYCASPSCTPARGGLLTGQDIWRLEEGGNLWSRLPKKFVTYVDLLERGGYFVGHEGKGWGPGSFADAGRTRNPAGETFESFEEFLKANTNNKPWSYWFCSTDPHRPYKLGSGIASGMDLGKVEVPPYLPDCKEVRGDICDYYFEIERFDRQVGETIRKLEAAGEIENTIIVIFGDNGWQMPRGLANLYDFGTRVPLIISWKERIEKNRVVNDFVNLNDLAPTFLELAGQKVPSYMTAKSMREILLSSKSGRIEKERDFVVIGRERHALCRKNGLGYPGRAIRTDDYLYIRNYEPDRWPAGDPPLFGDIDAHMLHYYSATKEYMMSHKAEPKVKVLYEQAFLKRLGEELYDLRKDPYQMNNVALDGRYAKIKNELSNKLERYLRKTGDPRILGKEIIWDSQNYYLESDFVARPSKEAIEKFHLRPEYDYRGK
jgi:arylsulfatase A-like enzyme